MTRRLETITRTFPLPSFAEPRVRTITRTPEKWELLDPKHTLRKMMRKTTLPSTLKCFRESRNTVPLVRRPGGSPPDLLSLYRSSPAWVRLYRDSHSDLEDGRTGQRPLSLFGHHPQKTGFPRESSKHSEEFNERVDISNSNSIVLNSVLILLVTLGTRLIDLVTRFIISNHEFE